MSGRRGGGGVVNILKGAPKLGSCSPVIKSIEVVVPLLPFEFHDGGRDFFVEGCYVG